MLRIVDFQCDGFSVPVGLSSTTPAFTWKLESDKTGVFQTGYRLTIIKDGSVRWDSGRVSSESCAVRCPQPFEAYQQLNASVQVWDNHGETACASMTLYTGKLHAPWQAKWIGSGRCNPQDNELPPECFRKVLQIGSRPVCAMLYASAMGIYDAYLNAQRINTCYFAPGHTHYQTTLQFQTYDVTALLSAGENDLRLMVANGWYLGQSGDRNNRYGERRGVIAELHLEYADGSSAVICSDESWQHTADTAVRYADFYNGETIDGTRADESAWHWQPAVLLDVEKELIPHHGAYVTEEQRLTPVSKDGRVFDFGQNHAGLLVVEADAPAGTVITIRHGELLDNHGELFTDNLRSAKQTLTLICGRDGVQTFEPRFTFMGFRYVEVTSTAPLRSIRLESRVLTSDASPIGEFSCSDALMTRFQQNIQWGQRSNFVDIPTDCPQRDERMGWTGDIAVFAATAAYNRDIRHFMRKWLMQLRQAQRPNGTLPVVIPENPTYQPTRYHSPIALWGDCATMVPWAVYQAYGDVTMLAEQYDAMKRYTDAEIRTANRYGKGKERWLWDKNVYQYGDWCAPGEDYYQWIAKGDDLATCFMALSVSIMAKAAHVLGKEEDAKHYASVMAKIRDAFAALCLREDGMLNSDFPSYYVCALHFGLIPEDKKPAVAGQLAEIVRAGGHRIQTGFAGTPYVAFALADNGYIEDAYKLVQSTECPGWLNTVLAGGTTVWERWDAMNAVDDSGETSEEYRRSILGMVSFNHYAYGAVGDFYYRRILGIEPIIPGYQHFRIKPVPGGTLTWAEGHFDSIHGRIAVRWERKGDAFTLRVQIPCNTRAEIILPDGSSHEAASGSHVFVCKM